jgi:hypothetical protein
VKGKPYGDTCIATDETCHETEEVGQPPTPAAGVASNTDKNSDEEAHRTGSVHVHGYYRKDGTYVHPHTGRAPHRHRADE